jgi:hypothetical protein
VSRTIAVYTSIFVAHDYVVVACAHDGDRVVYTTAVSDEGTRWTVSGQLARGGRGADRRNGSCGTRTREQFADGSSSTGFFFFVVLERTKESGEGEC